MTKDPEDGKPSRLKIITSLGYLIVMLAITFLITSIERNSAQIDNLRDDVEKWQIADERALIQLDAKLDAEIDALLESNRNRRNSIAVIEQDIARLRAEMDLILP